MYIKVSAKNILGLCDWKQHKSWFDDECSQILDRRKYKLFLDLKKAHDSIRRKILYNILIVFGIHMKLVRLRKVCLGESCSSFQLG